MSRGNPGVPYLGALTPAWLAAHSAYLEAHRRRVDRLYHRWQTERAAELAAMPSVYGSPIPYIGGGDMGALIRSVFGPTGDAAVSVADCESKLHPNSINPTSGAAGLFQFLPSWWDGKDDVAFTDDDQWNPLDPVVNTEQAYAASAGGTDWGPWSCKP